MINDRVNVNNGVGSKYRSTDDIYKITYKSVFSMFKYARMQIYTEGQSQVDLGEPLKLMSQFLQKSNRMEGMNKCGFQGFMKEVPKKPELFKLKIGQKKL